MGVEPLPKLTAAADASFLIGLCFIDQVHLLRSVFGAVHVAAAVWEEVVLRGKGKPGVDQIQQADFIQRHQVQNQATVSMLRVFLGTGAAETLALAQEMGCPLVLMDDLKARKAAQQAGIRTMGVVGFLLAAKRCGLIKEVRPLLETLNARGFRIGRTLIQRALQDASENPE